jgi:hypothetical protein
MKLRHIYLLLLIVGVILPYWQITPWFLKNGLDAPLFFNELFSNRVSGSFGMDIIVSTAVLLIFAWFEIVRLQMKRGRLIFVAVLLGTFGAGVSAGFPLFLYLRQRHFDNL